MAVVASTTHQELTIQQVTNDILSGKRELIPGITDLRISPEVKMELVVHPLRTWMERHKQKLGPNYIDLSKKDVPWGDPNLRDALGIYQTYELLWAKKYYTDTPLADHHYRNLGINRDDISKTVDQKTLASFLKNGLLLPDSQQGRAWAGTALPRISRPTHSRNRPTRPKPSAGYSGSPKDSRGRDFGKSSRKTLV